ncbi:MAG: ribosome recycling factor [Candidatus Moranbacteria bacterium]|nr:ribosome recycling factor [Candidatus Moranbacteria bacterium]
METELSQLKQDFEKSIQSLKNELASIRAGRASTGLVENLKINYYGNPTPMNQVAQISAPDAKTIMIAPWNKGDLEKIEKAINESDLSLNPNNNGEAVILNLPPLTQERRQELSKLVNQKIEAARVSLRNKREKQLDFFNQAKKNNQISQDQLFNFKNDLQKLLDEYMNRIEEIKQIKEREISGN